MSIYAGTTLIPNVSYIILLSANIFQRLSGVIVVSDGVKVRFIIDLRYINNFMKKYNFKLETIKVIRRMIFKGDYFISVDLSKAYNLPKSMTKPSRICIHLGFILDSMKMTVQAAQRQQNNIKDAVAVLLQFKQGNNMSLREFAKLPGRIISQMPAVGPVARIF